MLSSVIGLAVLAFISNHTLKMLVRMRRRLQRRVGRHVDVGYTTIGAYAMGAWGRRMAVFAELATNLGIGAGLWKKEGRHRTNRRASEKEKKKRRRGNPL